MLFAVAALLLAAGVVLAFLFLARSRRREVVVESPASVPETASSMDAAFAGLSALERCDFIFACEALDDRESLIFIKRALDDPCESVAIAAARAFARRGHTEELERYFAQRSDERSLRIARAVELLA